MQATSRLAAILGLSLGWAACVYGQNGTQPANILREPLPKTEQKVQNIVIEDDANRIQERRFGGQTERITVIPKANMPEYEVLPDNPSRAVTGDGLKPHRGTSGQRVWNIFSF
jgi:starvation-inducible outer membrane lipoprotein